MYCGQTAGWIKIGLGPGHIVLDEDPAPPLQRDTAPNFRAMSIVAKRSPISVTAEHLLFVYEISREPLNGFAPNSQRKTCLVLARMSLNVKVKGQRSSSPRTKTAFFVPFGGLHPFCVW